jgi:hypothetical protein
MDALVLPDKPPEHPVTFLGGNTAVVRASAELSIRQDHLFSS